MKNFLVTTILIFAAAAASAREPISDNVDSEDQELEANCPECKFFLDAEKLKRETAELKREVILEKVSQVFAARKGLEAKGYSMSVQKFKEIYANLYKNSKEPDMEDFREYMDKSGEKIYRLNVELMERVVNLGHKVITPNKDQVQGTIRLESRVSPTEELTKKRARGDQ